MVFRASIAMYDRPPGLSAADVCGARAADQVSSLYERRRQSARVLSGNSPASPLFSFDAVAVVLRFLLPQALDESPGLQPASLFTGSLTSSKTPRLPPPRRASALKLTASTLHSPSACTTIPKFPRPINGDVSRAGALRTESPDLTKRGRTLPGRGVRPSRI